jgi:hypothetical protein
MSDLDDARKTLRTLLEDMAALKEFADPGNAKAAPVRQRFRGRARAGGRGGAGVCRGPEVVVIDSSL